MRLVGFRYYGSGVLYTTTFHNAYVTHDTPFNHQGRFKLLKKGRQILEVDTN